MTAAEARVRQTLARKPKGAKPWLQGANQVDADGALAPHIVYTTATLGAGDNCYSKERLGRLSRSDGGRPFDARTTSVNARPVCAANWMSNLFPPIP